MKLNIIPELYSETRPQNDNFVVDQMLFSKLVSGLKSEYRSKNMLACVVLLYTQSLHSSAAWAASPRCNALSFFRSIFPVIDFVSDMFRVLMLTLAAVPLSQPFAFTVSTKPDQSLLVGIGFIYCLGTS